MIVSCPHCAAVYELPKHLLGPGGAAVRCPHCTGEFTLGADGEVIGAGGAQGAAPAPSKAASRPAPAPASAEEPAPARAAAHTPVAAPARAAAREPKVATVPARAPAHASAAAAESVAKVARASAATHAPASTQPSAARAAAAAPSAPADETDPARVIARRVLDELAARKGTAIKDANARGKLLSEFGPDLIAAFEEFRKQSGAGTPTPFREELRERFGIDLRPQGD